MFKFSIKSAQAVLTAGLLLAGCGGGGGGASTTTSAISADASSGTSSVTGTDGSTASIASTSTNTDTATAALSYYDAWRLADQATFGPSEALITTIKALGAAPWISNQMALRQSRYTSGGTAAMHQYVGSGAFCDDPSNGGTNCWRDNYSSIPLVWDFYRNATTKSDQLRQRVAFALQQILVVSGLELEGTYGFRNYQNILIDNAFGNYGDILKSVILSPFMGDYLNNANNDKAAPSENFARELLQLFSLGTCLLNPDGTQQTGTCVPTFVTANVRAYAYALTGWTYPAGGATSYGCWPAGSNCRFYQGDMVPNAALHDTEQRVLLSGVTVPAGQSAPTTLNNVLASLMAHPNMAPLISKQLIQHLVTANPTPAYVQRVAAVFTSGRYTSGTTVFGTGSKGDLAATVAAILLDAEARGPIINVNSGKLREPVLLFTGVLRQYAGTTDGDALAWWWGDLTHQHVFRPPSVFNFYPPDYAVAGTTLKGPSFALDGASAALQRLNFLTFMIDWGGMQADSTVPGAIGTHIDLSAFKADAADAAKLVDRLSLLAIGQPLASSIRDKIIAAVEDNNAAAADQRVKTAAYLVLSTPDYQVQP